ncbi:MAG: TonB-dependent receptor [Mediterranea sp.]|nr:TonB-dependent receptor [Mediterranea sp.]
MASAQGNGKRITGQVTDENREPLIGVSILIEGSSAGTVTDVDGRYALDVPAGARQLRFSYVGYQPRTVDIPATGQTLDVRMQSDARLLGDVVVIGYGTQRKSDLTGSVTNVSSKDFAPGLIGSAEQLINGKVSGVQIMSNSGSPTAGSTIRIRGGASLNASNDPLIVLDGVPLERGGISGNDNNFLSLINPNDIEDLTILKDASSTAIYGSRASNGVVIITSKKGSGGKPKFSFTTTNSVQTRTRVADMLDYDQFVATVRGRGTAAQQALLGDARTDWNKATYQNAFGTDNNLSVTAKWARVSIGYYKQNGLLRTDKAERYTASTTLSPSFFDDHLRLNVNLKGAINKNRFGNTSAIWAAAVMNPTLPVYSGQDTFGGYTEAIDNTGAPVNGAVLNPVGLVELNDSRSNVKRFIGNIDADYRLHVFPDLRLHATLGYDYAAGKGTVYVPAGVAQSYNTSGLDYAYGPQKKENRLITLYANYNKTVESIDSNFDVTAGYDYQYWKATAPQFNQMNTLGEIQSTSKPTDERHVLLSYYGRLNYSLASRYMLTATVRRDATSRFNPDVRWGTFPSVALGWRVSEEAFMRRQQALSTLKLRASYGVTGQQDGIGNYGYLPVYTLSQDGAQAIMGNNYVYTYRPSAYEPDRKWETTTSWNIGLDFGFLKDRITGSIDYYTRRTKDLIATVPAAAGTTPARTTTTNVGNVDSQGLEFSLNATPIKTRDWSWDLSFNLTWQRMKVKNLSLVAGAAATNTSVGPYIDNYQVQTLTEGYEPYMFYVYHQLYDEKSGKPVEGAYVDMDGDGQINANDLYRYHSPAPDYLMGFSTSLTWKRWTLSTSLRANIGNYVYNGMAMNTGAWETMSYNTAQLNNLSASYLKTGFQSRQYLSDYYVENASFVKMDNLTLGYNFGEIAKGYSLSVSLMAQNLFCVTKYTGVDPEVPNGVDNTFYPRPRTFSIHLGLNF